MNLVENQIERTIKTLRTDRGREYLSKQFRELCENKGIRRQLTIPGTLQQNGVAERRNRTLLDMVRSMMAQANLLISFWGDALMAVAYILNRVPSKSVPSTPYELWSGKKPDLSNLRPWGCAGYIHNATHKHGKLSPRANKCVFIRYSDEFKGYVMLGEHPDGGVTEIMSHHVEFMENDFPSRGDVGQSLELYEMVESWDDTLATNPRDSGREITLSGSDPQLQEDDSQNPQLCRSQRRNVPRRRFGIEGESFISATQDDTEPRSYDEAMSSPACNEWMTAMKDEMESMRTNQVWELADLPPRRKSIGNKWVLKIKRKANGSIDKYKARLVAKAMVASLNLELHQMDVKTAFLNEELDEEIFMDQPIGFVVKGQERKVCRLNRSLYELKQSSRQWYKRFHQEVIFNGFLMIEEDHCVYVKRSEGSFIILSLYVDDILLAGNDKEFIKTIKEWLSSTFEMKDMGEASFVLGVKILRDRLRKLLGLSQETYIRKVLKQFHMQDCKPIDTPVGKGDSLRLVSRFQSNPGPTHWKAVKRILRYLHGTADYMLCYQGRDLRLRGYSDADWVGDLDKRKSTSGYIFLLVVQEAVWLRRFLQRLDIVASAMDPVTIYSDSMAALAYAKNPKYHGKTKHIEIKYHYIRDMVAKKEVFLEHISTKNMLANPLTKPIARDPFHSHIKGLGLHRV
uniref:Integrase catalytic domain-containing protein n=1 Tax=Fagus sylvatica TaxID=28930 RepID=A0A2N9FVA6_FAGSY